MRWLIKLYKFELLFISTMNHIKLTLLAITLALATYNVAFSRSSGQPENEALAAELNFFTVKTINQTSLLAWSSSVPMKNNYFSIERSLDGKNYTEIGKVKSNGLYHFNFVDYKPNLSINFYRFKKVEFDGTIAVSPVRITIPENNSPFILTPSVVKNNLRLVNSANSKLGNDFKIKMVLIATGEILYETDVELNKNKTDINLTTLPPGNYVAKIQKGEMVFNHSFVKQ